MKKPYRGMSPLVTLLTAYLDNVGRAPIAEATLADIERNRATVYPTRPPFSWITGPIAAEVTRSDGRAPVDEETQVPLRWYRPQRPREGRPLLVYFHGGGWVQGSPRMYDPLCTHLARELDAVVVSVDYRMAPEHRAPTAARDAIAVTRWLAGRTEAGYDNGRIALAGDSAGGNLAAVVAQQLRGLTHDGLPVIRHQALIYPATDLTLSSPSIQEHAHAPILDEAAVHAFRRLYLGEGADSCADTDPLVSPLFGDLDGVAPALVQTGDLDPIRDDGVRYASALRLSGVEVRATNYVGLPHGFASFPGVAPAGAQHRAELVTELRRHLEPEMPS